MSLWLLVSMAIFVMAMCFMVGAYCPPNLMLGLNTGVQGAVAILNLRDPSKRARCQRRRPARRRRRH